MTENLPPGQDGDVGPVDAISYKISISETADGLRVQTTGEFIAREALTDLPLDYDLSTPPRAVINDAERPCKRDAPLHIRCPIAVPAAKGSRIRLTWRHDVPWTDEGQDATNSPFHRDGTNWTTVHWPNRARSWLALHDHPSDAAAYAIDVTASNTKVVLSNGVLLETRPVSDAESIWRYEMASPIQSYGVFVGVTDVLQKTAFPAGEGGVVVEVWAKKTRDENTIRDIFSDVPAAIAFLKQNYGEYRFGNTLRYIEATTGWGGAMEHVGAIAFDPNVFADSTRARHTAFHELAHHWSGNLVRLKSWDDFWMSESFAEYLAHRVIERLDGRSASQGYWNRSYAAAKDDTLRHPLHFATEADQDPTPNTVVRKLFDGVPYTKGAVTVRSIENRLGRAAFDPWLRRWFDGHAFRPTTTADLRGSLEATTEDPWDVFFVRYIDGTELPPL